MAPEGGISRREWLTGVLGTAAVATLGARRTVAAADKVRIVRVEAPAVWKGDNRDPEVVAAMVTRGLLAFTGETRPEAAWGRLFKPGMRVGLKLNLLGQPLVYTAREMAEAVAAGVILAGVKPSDVIVWDRKAEHFPGTVYRPGTGKHGERIQIGGTYSRTTVLKASGGDAPMDTIPLEQTDVTVNLPVLKDHGGAGFTGALKNIAFGCYRNHRQAHSGNCDPYITEAYSHFVGQTRVPLIVLDATNACFDDGPAPRDVGAIWHENAIYVAADPVALDVVCRQLIMQKRSAAGRSNILSQARHIETSARQGLGVGDLSRIDLVTVRV